MEPHSLPVLWTPQPVAAQLVEQFVSSLMARSPWAVAMAQRMRQISATDFTAWLDQVVVAPDVSREATWSAAGFVGVQQAGTGRMHYQHPGGHFPMLVSDPQVPAAHLIMVVRVDSVESMRVVWGGEVAQGALGSPGRSIRLAQGDDWAIEAVERHGGIDVPAVNRPVEVLLRHQESLRNRPRSGAPAALFRDLRQRVHLAVADLGQDEACSRFFAAERDYWQQRNRAGRIQGGRQDALGLGWANHDHHTYRSSRRWFSELIGVLALLGLQVRERFHAGAEAGWGAQVLENPRTGIVVFADVDLTPEEIVGDLGQVQLPELSHLGTVGLWCALHGEAILDAGMHHLECTFLHDELTAQLRELGVPMMKPFTDLTVLKQAFTQGERWPVSARRLIDLVQRGALTHAQAEDFRQHGALGSHLENLERRDGYKGFNQRGVSHIIAETDPRTQPAPRESV